MSVHNENKSKDGAGETWTIANNHLVYLTKEGATTTPTAREIWDSIYGDNSSYPINPAVALRDYEFSRFQAEPKLLLTGKSPENIRVDLVGSSSGEYAAICEIDTDQLFIGKTWYPFSLSGYGTSLSALKEQKITFGQTITVGQLIWLKTHTDSCLDLIDNLEQFTPAATRAPTNLDPAQWGLKAIIQDWRTRSVARRTLRRRLHIPTARNALPKLGLPSQTSSGPYPSKKPLHRSTTTKARSSRRVTCTVYRAGGSHSKSPVAGGTT